MSTAPASPAVVDGLAAGSSPPRVQVAFETPWFTVEAIHSGTETEDTPPYYRITGPDGVICFVLDTQGRLALVRQFRPSLEQETLEVPAGAIDPGETAREAAFREIIEETGLTCGHLIQLGVGRLQMNRHRHQETFFLAIDAQPAADVIQETGIELVWLSRQDFAAMIRTDTYEQSGALAALVMARIKFGLDILETPLPELVAAVGRIEAAQLGETGQDAAQGESVSLSGV